MENKKEGKKVVVIAGGGPAGLTAAYELATRAANVHPIVYEASDMLGGISRTVNYKGNRMDIGGHRFFSKESRVTDRWKEIMPMQTAPAKDERLLGEEKGQSGADSTDPELSDKVMLRRRRISRIYFCVNSLIIRCRSA